MQFMIIFRQPSASSLDEKAFLELPGVNALAESMDGTRGMSPAQRPLAACLAGFGGLFLIMGAWLFIPTREEGISVPAKSLGFDAGVQVCEASSC